MMPPVVSFTDPETEPPDRGAVDEASVRAGLAAGVCAQTHPMESTARTAARETNKFMTPLANELGNQLEVTGKDYPAVTRRVWRDSGPNRYSPMKIGCFRPAV